MMALFLKTMELSRCWEGRHQAVPWPFILAMSKYMLSFRRPWTHLCNSTSACALRTRKSYMDSVSVSRLPSLKWSLKINSADTSAALAISNFESNDPEVYSTRLYSGMSGKLARSISSGGSIWNNHTCMQTLVLSTRTAFIALESTHKKTQHQRQNTKWTEILSPSKNNTSQKKPQKTLQRQGRVIHLQSFRPGFFFFPGLQKLASSLQPAAIGPAEELSFPTWTGKLIDHTPSWKT